MPDELATNGRKSGDEAFAELRDILVGPEREKIRQIQQRLDDRAGRAEEISRTLPDAIRLQSARGHKLRLALQPILEDSIRISVQRNPEILSEALFPLISETVRKAVSAALQTMLQTLNQTLEQSVSARSFRWRWEAVRTGKSFGEIVLLRSLLYKVEQVFLIHRKSGLLLAHCEAESAVVKDADLVSGMLTAIQDFVHDSFGGKQGQDLETARVGEHTLWIQYGPQAILAAVVRGTPPMTLKNILQPALERICAERGAELTEFNGDVTPFQSSQKHLKACLVGQASKQKGGQSVLLWLVPSVLALAAAFWLFVSIREAREWKQYLQALSREPGIVITSTEKRGGEYLITGLRDPLARDPATLLAATGLPAGKVKFALQDYQSLQEPFGALRELDAAKNNVESRKVHFRPDRAEIALEQLDSVERAAADINALLERARRAGKPLRIEIVGHTDDSGPESRNAELSQQRAAETLASLSAAGVPRERISLRGAGTTEPQSKGTAERDRAFNRSVSFRVLPAQP
jgi:outer membrane protein OmpA-like peptidoglycan-associated protein